MLVVYVHYTIYIHFSSSSTLFCVSSLIPMSSCWAVCFTACFVIACMFVSDYYFDLDYATPRKHTVYQISPCGPFQNSWVFTGTSAKPLKKKELKAKPKTDYYLRVFSHLVPFSVPSGLRLMTQIMTNAILVHNKQTLSKMTHNQKPILRPPCFGSFCNSLDLCIVRNKALSV